MLRSAAPFFPSSSRTDRRGVLTLPETLLGIVLLFAMLGCLLVLVANLSRANKKAAAVTLANELCLARVQELLAGGPLENRAFGPEPIHPGYTCSYVVSVAPPLAFRSRANASVGWTSFPAQNLVGCQRVILTVKGQDQEVTVEFLKYSPP